MGNMRFKVGDRVRIKSIDWYNENKDKNGYVDVGVLFDKEMSRWCGKTMTIIKVNQLYYTMEEDGISQFFWTDEMIECKVEEENKPKLGTASNPLEPKSNANWLTIERVDELTTKIDKDLSSENQNVWELPEGYIFKDENGNVINAQKIVLEKKKKEYPKTYEECLKILGFTTVYTPKVEPMFDYDDDIIALQKLKNCRNAYWKIAGEEMGLGKPWEPDWDAKDNHFYTIHTFNGKIECSATAHRNAVLIFPTEEMRDAFYENFKELINECKELL